MASVELWSELTPQVLSFPLHTTHGSFSKGDLVDLAAGKVIIATAGNILGIARNAYNKLNAKGEVDVELIDVSAIYSARYKASATAQALVGDLLDFTFTVGAHTLDESSATTDVYCVGLDPRDAVTTSGGRLLVRFLGALLTSPF